MRAEDRRILVETLKVICRRDVVVATESALCHGLISCRTKEPVEYLVSGTQSFLKAVPR